MKCVSEAVTAEEHVCFGSTYNIQSNVCNTVCMELLPLAVVQQGSFRSFTVILAFPHCYFKPLHHIFV